MMAENMFSHNLNIEAFKSFVIINNLRFQGYQKTLFFNVRLIQQQNLKSNYLIKKFFEVFNFLIF